MDMPKKDGDTTPQADAEPSRDAKQSADTNEGSDSNDGADPNDGAKRKSVDEQLSDLDEKIDQLKEQARRNPRSEARSRPQTGNAAQDHRRGPLCSRWLAKARSAANSCARTSTTLSSPSGTASCSPTC